MTKRKCYICPSDRFVHNHHYDRCRGQISDETVPLCRRCHFTLHSLDLKWFDDEYLDRALEVWNRGQELRGRPLVTKEEVLRRKYPPEKVAPVKSKVEPLQLITEPLCGWDWIGVHRAKFPDGLPEQSLVIIRDGEELATVNTHRKGLIKAVMKAKV